MVQNRLPEDVPGLGDLKNRRDRLQAIVENLKSHQHGSSNQAGVVRGRLLIGDDVEQLLADTGVSREAMVDLGLEFIRRRDHDDRTYFVVNNSDSKVDQWVPLSVDASKVVLLDPATAQIGLAASRRRSNSTEVYLQLRPRETVFILASNEPMECPSWKYLDDGKSVALTGKWQVEFVKGGPALPKTQSVDKLFRLDHMAVRRGGIEVVLGLGTLSARIRETGANADAWSIDLGDVCHSARVRLNGKELGTISAPYRVDATSSLRPGKNQLEIEVANQPANRVADSIAEASIGKHSFSSTSSIIHSMRASGRRLRRD